MDFSPIIKAVITLSLALVAIDKYGKVKHGDKKTNDNSKESEDI